MQANQLDQYRERNDDVQDRELLNYRMHRRHETTCFLFLQSNQARRDYQKHQYSQYLQFQRYRMERDHCFDRFQLFSLIHRYSFENFHQLKSNVKLLIQSLAIPML